MGNSVSGKDDTPHCSTTIVITPPTYSQFYEEFPLTDREKSIIQKSWTYSEQRTFLNLGQRLLRKVFLLAPECKKIFHHQPSTVDSIHDYNCSFYKHIRAVMNLMELAISRIDDEDGGERLWRTCFEVGKRHARFRERGFKEEYWMTFKVAMLQCAIEWEGEQCNRRSVEAWSKFLTYIVSQMKSGYEYEIVAKGRSLSMPNYSMGHTD